MIKLVESLNAWATPHFNETLKRELEALSVESLPLQQSLRVGSYALDDTFSVMVISTRDGGDVINAKVGIFFNSIIAGCSCADDPTPVEAVNEFCELSLRLDKRSGEAEVTTVE